MSWSVDAAKTSRQLPRVETLVRRTLRSRGTRPGLTFPPGPGPVRSTTLQRAPLDMARDVGDQHKAGAVRLGSSLARRRRNQTADIDETAPRTHVRTYARTYVRTHASTQAGERGVRRPAPSGIRSVNGGCRQLIHYRSGRVLSSTEASCSGLVHRRSRREPLHSAPCTRRADHHVDNC